MSKIPASVADFLAGERFAVAGVSRTPPQPANAIFQRLRDSGYETYAVNPRADEVEGEPCYPDLASVPAALDGVVVATHPEVSASVVEECAELGIGKIWFHRSIGQGSVSDEAVRACEEAEIDCIVGGCPMMFCEPVDFGHKCMRWLFQRTGSVPR